MPEPQILASQLRKPQGELGTKVALSMNMSNALVTSITYDLMDLSPNDYVLEIGFGNGKLLPELVERAGAVAGIDYSDDMVSEAMENNHDAIESGKLELQYGSISDIPYPDQTFDKVCTINTLYFGGNPLEDLHEIKRVLKPGGMLCLGIRSRDTLGQAPFTAYGFTLYNLDEAIALLREAGFKNITHRSHFEEMTQLEGIAIRAVV